MAMLKGVQEFMARYVKISTIGTPFKQYAAVLGLFLPFLLCRFDNVRKTKHRYFQVGQIRASSTEYFKHATATVNLDYTVVFLDYNMDKIIEMKKSTVARLRSVIRGI